METYWECPICEWRLSDTEHFYIVLDPLCQGCGIKTYSEFRYVIAKALA